jgi:hypothetical protein
VYGGAGWACRHGACFSLGTSRPGLGMRQAGLRNRPLLVQRVAVETPQQITSKRRSPWLCPAPSLGAGFFVCLFGKDLGRLSGPYVEAGNLVFRPVFSEHVSLCFYTFPVRPKVNSSTECAYFPPGISRRRSTRVRLVRKIKRCRCDLGPPARPFKPETANDLKEGTKA